MGLRNILLVVGSTLVASVCGELIVRVGGLAPEIARLQIDKPYGSFTGVENPILRYVPRPGFGDINRLGFRDREYPTEKPPDVYRIVAIGDSITFGFCNDDLPAIPIDKTFSKLLERRLNAASLGSRRFEVINLGVSGYDSRQEVEFLKLKGLSFSPDLVLVGYCLNDRSDASAELNDFGWLGAGSKLLFVHSALARFLWQRSSTIFRTTQEKDNRVELAFDELKVLGGQHHFSVATAIFPNLRDFGRYRSSQWFAEHTYAREQASLRGFSVLDLLQTLEEGSKGDYQSIMRPCRNPHPNEAGHDLIAGAIENHLRTTVLADLK